jgi:CheY-like chemotaxis protein
MNGKEAVETAQKDTFDLIFMDCQMPEMDGFEASRRITELKEKGIITSLPIIALTANAMKGDHERCIDAGMNDYLTKPIRRNEIVEKLQKWVKSSVIQ